MKTLIFMITYALSASATVEVPHQIIEIAVDNCRNVPDSRRDEALVVATTLFEVEQKYDVPPELTGMILAAACTESGFNPRAKGDRKFSKSGKKPMAIGVLQLWKYYERTYGTDRTDPNSSAEAWMKHIARMIPKVKKQCRYKTPEKIWIAAWVTGIRYKKKGGRCREKPKHLRYLRKIHLIYDKLCAARMNP